MATLTIVADENIPMVEEYFSGLGQVIRVNGRQLHNNQLLAADILLVRSVTLVNEALLAGSSIRFVGTATIGIDHLDIDYLDQQNIAWASAPGSNADSVVEYVLSACCRLDGVLEGLLNGARVGIVGMGNVGSRLYQRLAALGVDCCAYDPLINQDCYPVLVDIETVLNADIICLHTPLTEDGDHPSFHLLNEQRLASIADGAVLINAGRGAVICNQALLALLEQRDDLCVVLDVWENEPTIDIELMKRVDFATPHIAGYSLDGKQAGSAMLYRACCQFLEQPVAEVANKTEFLNITLSELDDREAGVREAVLSSYDIARDDQMMRGKLLHCGEGSNDSVVTERMAAFDALRKEYPVRREFSCFVIENAGELDSSLRNSLIKLGFNCAIK